MDEWFLQAGRGAGCFARDVDIATEVDACETVPALDGGAFTAH